MKTNKAIKDCLNWLMYCKEIGWNISDVDKLEKLWWEYHDENGLLIR